MRRALPLLLLLAAGCSAYTPKPLDTRKLLDDLRATAPPSPPEGGLDPDRAVAFALVHNPSLRALRRTQQIAENAIVSARAWQNPELNFDLKLPISLDLGLRIFPPLPGERAARIEGAQADLRRALAEIEAQENKLCADVRLLHAEITMIEARIAVGEAALRLHHRLYDVVQMRVDHAAAPKLDLVLAGMKISQVEIEQQDLLIRRDAASAELGALLGVPVTERIPVGPGRRLADLGAIGQEALEDQALAARPDLRALKEEYEAREQELKLAELQKIPWPRYGQPGVANLPSKVNPELSGSITLPIFNQNEGPIAIAEARREMARDAYLARLTTMRSEIRVASIRLAAEEQRRRYFNEKLAPSIVEAEQVIEQALGMAEGDPLKLGTAMVRVFEMRAEAANIAFACEKAAIQLALATGTILAR
ncbi:MAG: TolC family protein [Byssovorax sp.]